MNGELQEFFKIDNDAFYQKKNGDLGYRSVEYVYDKTRNNKAKEQATLQATPLNEVIGYVNELLELLKSANNVKQEDVKFKQIELDNVEHCVLDNGIIAKGCEWKPPVYDKDKKEYTSHDNKYDVIKCKFQLRYPNDIVWLKFTKKGYLGVVAQSFDINFNNDNSSGKLVAEVHHEWDESFTLIFPLTAKILGQYQRKDIETAVGNYLISKGVPIIDFYSHNY